MDTPVNSGIFLVEVSSFFVDCFDNFDSLREELCILSVKDLVKGIK